MIKILHFGDMHLDSPFSGVSTSAGEKLREEQRNLFSEIMKTGADYDAVLIAGDLFDCAYISPDTVKAVKSAIEDCGKPVVIAPGNHDPYTAGSVWALGNWPSNAFIFQTDTLSHFDFDTDGGPMSVWGWAFTSDRLDKSPLCYGMSPDRNRLNIICGHGDIQSPISKYCPLTPGELAACGCSYVALGHVHRAPEPALYGKTAVAYCGFPKGRSWDEAGNGSVMSVSFNGDGMPYLEKIITEGHTYEIVEADITGIDSDEEAAKTVSLLINRFTDSSVMVYLDGAVPPMFKPDCGRIAGMSVSEDSALTVTVRDRTVPIYGADYLLKDMTVRGEFYRNLVEKLGSTDIHEREVAAEALRIGLMALEKRAF